MTKEQKEELLMLIAEYADCCHNCGTDYAEPSEFVIRDASMDEIRKFLNTI